MIKENLRKTMVNNNHITAMSVQGFSLKHYINVYQVLIYDSYWFVFKPRQQICAFFGSSCNPQVCLAMLLYNLVHSSDNLNISYHRYSDEHRDIWVRVCCKSNQSVIQKRALHNSETRITTNPHQNISVLFNYTNILDVCVCDECNCISHKIYK